MPVDYSKFDKIEDSDEEAPPARPAPSVQHATSSARPAIQGRNGRELLEPAGLEEKLSLIGGPRPAGNKNGAGGYPSAAAAQDPRVALAEQLERLAGPSGANAGAGVGGQQDQPARKPGEPQRVCMKADGMKKIHTTYDDGREMVEEYDDKSGVLMLRKTRQSTNVLGREAQWVYEVGQPSAPAFDPHSDSLRASAANPIFLRKDTPEHFQWRIRNLSYPAEVYSVVADHEKQQIVVRTSNKKYFKRIDVPDLRRVSPDLKLKDDLLSWKHQHNTLIISYIKPQEVIAAEMKHLKESEKAALKM
jgi:hypothetical protein